MLVELLRGLSPESDESMPLRTGSRAWHAAACERIACASMTRIATANIAAASVRTKIQPRTHTLADATINANITSFIDVVVDGVVVVAEERLQRVELQRGVCVHRVIHRVLARAV